MMISVYYLVTLICFVHVMICAGNINIQKASAIGRRKQLLVAGPECSLRVDSGDCKKSIKKYYYDASTGFCMEFNYTGCGGNLNNFLSVEKCYNRCLCSNPKDSGLGPQRIKRYFYNTETETCQTFKYRGSGGNSNRFFSLAQCQDVCESVVVRRNCKERPEVGTDCNNNSTVKFYYDKHCDCCRKFTYLGCGGNQNRFSTRKECSKTCKAEDPSTPAPPTRPPKPALCFFQNVYGDCNERRTRYFYDNQLSRCVPFTYSGCGGNENNFMTLGMCRATCEKN